MGLPDSGSWHGTIYSNGWADGSGGEAFTETQWVTVRGDLPAYPF
jgi:hypothetical protein